MTRVGVALRTAVLSAAAVVALGGCSNAVEGLAEGAVERAIENEIGGSADVSVDDDSFTIDTEDGSISAGSGSLPDDFPADVPLPDGEVTFSQRLESGDELGWSVVIASVEPAGALAEQVQADLQASGFTVEQASQFSGTDSEGGTIFGEKGDLSILVVVASDGDQTLATFTVSQASQQ